MKAAVLFAAVLAALARPGVVPAAAVPAGATRVSVEVFRVGLDGRGGLAFTRSEAPLRDGLNPDDRSRSLAADDPGDLAALHSTSWRWEKDGRIVLTYLAWMKDGRVGREARPLPPLRPPGPTDPLHPRPAEMRELDPLAHGLRHLAFLLRTGHDGRLAEAIGEKAASALRALEPAVAGELAAP